MDFASCYRIGYISKTHGLKGELVITLDVDDPFSYQNLESVLLSIDSKLVPFFIDSLKMTQNKSMIKFDEYNCIEDVNHLIGVELYLPLEQLPNKSSGKFFFHDLLNYSATDVNFGYVGKVQSIYEGGGQPIIGLEKDGKEILVPINSDDILKEVNHDKKEVLIELPTGLLEIYLDDEN